MESWFGCLNAVEGKPASRQYQVHRCKGHADECGLRAVCMAVGSWTLRELRHDRFEAVRFLQNNDSTNQAHSLAPCRRERVKQRLARNE